MTEMVAYVVIRLLNINELIVSTISNWGNKVFELIMTIDLRYMGGPWASTTNLIRLSDVTLIRVE